MYPFNTYPEAPTDEKVGPMSSSSFGAPHSVFYPPFAAMRGAGFRFPTSMPSVSPSSIFPPTFDTPEPQSTKDSWPLKITDFECSVCFSLLCEPVTISCGHTFCRSCLVSCLERTKKKCPSCRAPCHVSAESHPSSILITSIIERLFPEEYKRRVAELESEKREWSQKIPLFLCSSPMFPNQPLSLHLFEPRYRLMVSRILNSNKRFGVIASDKVKAGDVGTVFEITECEILADGRALIESVGRTRFTVREFWLEDGTQGLHYATMQEFEDEKEHLTPTPISHLSEQRMDADMMSSSETPTQPNPLYLHHLFTLSQTVRETMKEFIHFMPHLRTQLEKHYGSMPGGLDGSSSTQPGNFNFIAECSKLSYWVASILPMPAQLKLQLLASKSIMARLETSINVLRSLLEDLRKRGPETFQPSTQQATPPTSNNTQTPTQAPVNLQVQVQQQQQLQQQQQMQQQQQQQQQQLQQQFQYAMNSTATPMQDPNLTLQSHFSGVTPISDPSFMNNDRLFGENTGVQ